MRSGDVLCGGVIREEGDMLCGGVICECDIK